MTTPLILELTDAQHEQINRVAGLLHTTPGDLGRMMLFSGLDSECDWSEFSQFVQAYLDRRASGEASEGPEGSRVEDQALMDT